MTGVEDGSQVGFEVEHVVPSGFFSLRKIANSRTGVDFVLHASHSTGLEGMELFVLQALSAVSLTRRHFM